MCDVRFARLCAIGVVMGIVSTAAAQDRTANRFDQMDPEIRKAAEIDFSTVNLGEVDARTRVIAGMALNEFLTVARNKAEHRVDLGARFVEEQKLTGEMASATLDDAPVEPMTFADGQKLAIAYVNTDAGQEHMAGKLTTYEPEMLGRLVSAYDNMNEKLWVETVALRRKADRIARFLDGKGKFDAFMTWAYTESRKAEEAHKQEMEKRQVDYAKRMERERAERRRTAEAKAQRRHEEKMKQLELAYQYKTEKLKAQADVAKSYNERYRVYNDWAWDGDYYRKRYVRRYYRR